MGYTRGNIAAHTKAAKENAASFMIAGFQASTTNGCTGIVAAAASIEEAGQVVAVVQLTHTILFAKFNEARQVVEITAIAGANQAVR
jgi:hypothetical protein